MRKILFFLIVVLLLSGCEEAQKEAQKVDSSVTLLKPQENDSDLARGWIKAYGDDLESVLHYNMYLTRVVVNRNAQTVDGMAGKIFSDPNRPDTLEARIEVLEKKNKIQRPKKK